MPLMARVTRTFLGILLAMLLGALLAPTAALHPVPARHAAAKPLTK
jgi:hypothetical protein